MKNNKFLTTIEDKIVATKLAPEQESFDKLVFFMNDDEIIKIPDSIEVIGSNTFCNHKNLIEVVIPEKLRIIEESVFLGYTNIKKL